MCWRPMTNVQTWASYRAVYWLCSLSAYSTPEVSNWIGWRLTSNRKKGKPTANLLNRYSALCWRPATHAQTWASNRALYRFGKLSKPTSKGCEKGKKREREWPCSISENPLKYATDCKSYQSS